MSIPFDEAWLNDREPDNDAILDDLYEKYLNRGYSPEVAERMALEAFEGLLESDNDAVFDSLIEKYLHLGHNSEVAERMAWDEFDKIGV